MPDLRSRGFPHAQAFAHGIPADAVARDAYDATGALEWPLNAARAVNFNTHARDKGGFVAGQVQRGIGHVKRGGKAAQRNRGQEFVSARIVQWAAGKLGGQAGVGVEHRIDAVHPNVVRAQLCGE